MQRQARVDDVLDDEHVPTAAVLVEILEQTNSFRCSVVRLELDEVERMRDGRAAREIRGEDDAALERHDEQQVASLVVGRDLGAELSHPLRQLGRREEDLALAGGAHEARSSRKRAASRSRSRL